MRLLKIKTLKPAKDGWVDKDMIMLHACFQLLVDFIEEENGLEDWANECYKDTVTELKYLYDWWKENSSTVTIDDMIAGENLMRLIKIRDFLWT